MIKRILLLFNSLFFRLKEEGKDLKFIENHRLAKIKLRQLKKLNQKTILGEELFFDIKTGQKWEKHESGGHTRSVGLRFYPYPTISETINIAINSKVLHETKGACSYLRDQEYNGQEYRKELIEELETNKNNLSKNKFEVIYSTANLDNNYNLRETLYKSDKEVDCDYKFYIELYERAKKLKRNF